jgi:CDP-2,3-bis-(O-geranylgeranyl)-sn-glycerol synthase
LQLLILLTLANGAPVVAKLLFGDYYSSPLDGSIKFFDGRPLFGASKTLRGILVTILITSACAPLLGLTITIGLVVATTAMAGDLFSSFIKRRLGLQPSSKVVGLDQIPESLFPLLVCNRGGLFFLFHFCEYLAAITTLKSSLISETSMLA